MTQFEFERHKFRLCGSFICAAFKSHTEWSDMRKVSEHQLPRYDKPYIFAVFFICLLLIVWLFST